MQMRDSRADGMECRAQSEITNDRILLGYRVRYIPPARVYQ